MMKKIAAMMAVLALAACKKEATDSNVAAAAPVATAPAPAGQDWTTTFAASPEGGFVMGNPNAAIKLVEYGSLTCPHCAEFSEKASAPLKALVQQGKLSWEFRNYVRDPVDMTATLVARCGGPATFFGMIDQLYATQRDWFEAKITQLQGVGEQAATLSPAQQYQRYAEVTGLKDFAAQRGQSSAKTDACFADQAESTRLTRMIDTANKMEGFVGTPTFLINGQLVPNAASWELLEPALKTAGA